MFRATSLFLSLSLLLTGADGIELFKLPGLISHYLEHRMEQPGMGVDDYLALHYNSRHADQPEHDENLPFKSHEHSTACSQLVAFSGEVREFSIRLFSPVINRIDVPLDVKIRHADGNGVWQPPRLG